MEIGSRSLMESGSTCTRSLAAKTEDFCCEIAIPKVNPTADGPVLWRFFRHDFPFRENLVTFVPSPLSFFSKSLHLRPYPELWPPRRLYEFVCLDHPHLPPHPLQRTPLSAARRPPPQMLSPSPRRPGAPP